MREWNRITVTTQRNPGSTCACCQSSRGPQTPCTHSVAPRKSWCLLQRSSTQAPAHYCRLHRMVTKPDQGSFQYTTPHSSKYPDKKNKVCFNTSTKISQSLQVTAPRPLKVKDTPVAPRSYTPTLQVVHPELQPSTTTFSSPLPYSGSHALLPLPHFKHQLVSEALVLLMGNTLCYGAGSSRALGAGSSARMVPPQQGRQVPPGTALLCQVPLPF